MARFGGTTEDVTPKRDDPPVTNKKPKEAKKPANTELVAVDAPNVLSFKKGGAGTKHLNSKLEVRDISKIPNNLWVEPLPKKTRIYRASECGKCVTALAALAMGIEPAEMPDVLQPALDAGVALEPVLLRKVRESGYRSVTWAEVDQMKKLELIAGVDPIEEQMQTRWFIGKKACVRAHPDDFMVGSEAPVWTNDGIQNLYDVEVKAFGKDLWEKWKRDGIDAFPGYAWQISARMHSHALPVLFGVGLKNDDGDDIVEMDVAIYHTAPIDIAVFSEKILAADAIARQRIPEKLPDCAEGHWPCPVYFLPQCKGNKDRKETITLDDTELGELARHFYTDTEDRTSANKSRDEFKEKIAKWFDSHPQHRDKSVVVVDATGANRFSVEWCDVPQPEKVIKAHTQRYPRVKLLSDQ